MINRRILWIAAFFCVAISQNAFADIYCPQTFYCVKGACKPPQGDPNSSYFHLHAEAIQNYAPGNGRYRFMDVGFSLSGANLNHVTCNYSHVSYGGTIRVDASQPLYPDYTDPNNTWYLLFNYKDAYRCEGDPKGCPLLLNPEEFSKRKAAQP